MTPGGLAKGVRVPGPALTGGPLTGGDGMGAPWSGCGGRAGPPPAVDGWLAPSPCCAPNAGPPAGGLLTGAGRGAPLVAVDGPLTGGGGGSAP
ncbi:hypothetical protein Nm8I071_21740 [Nonomuraea sp. TT08I-71]|nr:hypothetical protein Nm8I071_21740 [Nonomuraea sp. TT08I-71]